MIEEIPDQPRQQWLAARHQNVTASQAAALLGIHPYLSQLELYMEKSAPLRLDDGTVSGPMERGLLLEPVAIAKLKRDHPDWEIWAPGKYYRDPVRRIGATPDAFCKIYPVANSGKPGRPGFGVIQFKSVEPSVFKRAWHNDAGEIEVPLWIAVQAAIEQELTGAAYAMVVPLVVGFSIEVHEIEIPYEPTLITRIEAEVREFWHRVENHRPPDVTSPRDAEVLQELYQSIGGTIDLRDDNELTALADEDKELKAQIKDATDRRGVIKGRYLAAMGEAGVGILADGRCIIRKRVDRKGYTVDPKSYIQVTVKEAT